MTKPGPKPKPTSLKLAQGTFRRDRDPVSNVKSTPVIQRPAAPKSLQKAGKRIWNEIADWMIGLKILESRFLHGMEMYCRAWDRLEHYEAVTAKAGEFTTVESGYVCAHPALGLAKQARDEIRRYQAEYGFTPSSASGIGGTPMKEKTGVPSRRRDMA